MLSALAVGNQDDHMEQEDPMSLDVEQNILRLTEGMARMEGTFERVEQKLDLHIKNEAERWMNIDEQVKTKRGWWQLAVSSLVSSGIVLSVFEFVIRVRH